MQFWSVADAWQKGVPDIHGVYDGRYFALELKADDGHVSLSQVRWLTDLGRAGAYTAVIRTNLKGPDPLRAQISTFGSRQPEFLSGNWLLDRLDARRSLEQSVQ